MSEPKRELLVPTHVCRCLIFELHEMMLIQTFSDI